MSDDNTPPPDDEDTLRQEIFRELRRFHRRQRKRVFATLSEERLESLRLIAEFMLDRRRADEGTGHAPATRRMELPKPLRRRIRRTGGSKEGSGRS